MITFIYSEKKDTIAIAKTLLNKLKISKDLTIGEYKSLLESSHSLLQGTDDNGERYNLGLSIICHVSEYLPKDVFIRQLLYDCIAASRVFLYNDMVNNKDATYEEYNNHSIYNYFSEAHYTLSSLTVLTKDQKNLFDTFQTKRRIIVSAPTSFGKSRIVQEIIIHNTYKNIAIILPTIALLNETYNKFKGNKFLSDYKLINSINNFVPEEKNIFILTPEKMDLLLDQNPNVKIDFFTMDEIYKIQDDIDRKKIFCHCLYRLSKQKNDFYLIGPYFDSFSKTFIEKTQSKFIRYTGEIVQKDTYSISDVLPGEKYLINNQEFKKFKDKDHNLLNLLSALNEQTLIYIGRKDSVESRAVKIADMKTNTRSSELIDYIKDNIAEDWSLVKCLEKGVGFHHSAIPKYIQGEIIDTFNAGEIDVVVCTSTLTEGVNTTAKNVVIYDNFKGKKNSMLSGFDVKNIKGRAGRFYSHFVGNVYSLEPLNEDSDAKNIEFSYFDNKEMENEEVVQVDKKELTEKNLALRVNIEAQLRKENIPFELIKKNKFIPIHSQIALINKLRSDGDLLRNIYFSGPLPEKQQLEIVLNLCKEFLFNERDREDKAFPIWDLIYQTKYYIYNNVPIKLLIANQKGAKTDTKIRSAFTLVTKYFEFALPKYFTAFENIFNFVWGEHHSNSQTISLKYLITKLEFGFVNHHEIAFKEAGLPNDIISKVSKGFKDCNSMEEIRIKLKLNPTLVKNLTSFERKIFNKYI